MTSPTTRTKRSPLAFGPMRRRLPALVAAAAVLGAAIAVVPTLSGASAPGSGSPSAVQASYAHPYRPVKGIAVDLTAANELTDRKAMVIGAQLFSLLSRHFHANAVSFNFPFWQASSRSNDPERVAMTPSPARLAALTILARRYHLTVQYRPYLYEGDLRGESRPSIQPTDPTLWFANYWTFLQPYLESANEAGASGFSVAVELTSLMPRLSQWTTLVQRSKSIYSGKLFYSEQHDPQETIPLTARGYDAYQPIRLSSVRLVSAARFTRGFKRNLTLAGQQATPEDLTIEELGIAAVAGAYNVPNFFRYSAHTKVDRAVQTDWFQGACNAFWSLHLAGIFYWSIDFNTFKPSEDSRTNIYNWLETPSATVIARCFARTH